MLQKELLETIICALNDSFQKTIIITHAEQVYGGDINETFVLHTSERNYFLKVNNDNQHDMFEKEFNGLKALQTTNTICVPEPLLCGNSNGEIFLMMEYIEKGRPNAKFWQSFGQQLAALHGETQTQFGFNENNYIGSLPQENTLTDTWAEFYSTQRIMPLMQKAYNQNKCSKEDLLKAEKLCKRFTELFPQEPPSLLHGDLWSGNYMVNHKGEPVMYDPAVYYGHREMDIAMSLLFGGFDKSFYDYYNEAFPLKKNWKQRVPLCQLYPLLVHLILFSGHYYYSVMDVINSF